MKTIKHDILALTNEDILAEMSDILGKPVSMPKRERLGYITDTPEEYIRPDGSVNEQELTRLYNECKELDRYATLLAFTSLRNRKKELFQHIKSGHYKAVLEYGCGVGTHGIACAQRGASVTFFDISLFFLNVVKQRCERRGLGPLLFAAGKESSYDGPDGIDVACPDIVITNQESLVQAVRYDFIICADVAEHHPHPDQMLMNFAQWMEPGGILHIHAGSGICHERGHLQQALTCWGGPCQQILKDKFIKIDSVTYKLRSSSDK